MGNAAPEELSDRYNPQSARERVVDPGPAVARVKRAACLLLLFVSLALSLSFGNQIALAPLAWLAAAWIDRRAFRVLADRRFLLFLGFIVLLVPLFCGTQDSVFVGLSYSQDVLRAGVVMAQRSIVILLGLRVFTDRVSVGEISSCLRGSRFRVFGQTLALAVDCLPQIRTIASETLKEYRQNEKTGARPAALFGFLVRFLVRLLRYAQAVQAE